MNCFPIIGRMVHLFLYHNAVDGSHVANHDNANNTDDNDYYCDDNKSYRL